VQHKTVTESSITFMRGTGSVSCENECVQAIILTPKSG